MASKDEDAESGAAGTRQTGNHRLSVASMADVADGICRVIAPVNGESDMERLQMSLLRIAVLRCLSQGNSEGNVVHGITLDFSAVEFIDEEAVAMLLHLREEVAEWGVLLVLVDVLPFVKRKLGRLGVLSWFGPEPR
jgi:anti-anti-sigma regulatory factor